MAVEWKETVLAPSHTLIESQLTRCLESFTQFTRPGALGTYCFDPKLDNGHWGMTLKRSSTVAMHWERLAQLSL